MNGVNLQAAINNVPQMDRFQQDLNRMPQVNQEQNALLSRQQQTQRALRPEAPEEAENKIVDPRENKRNPGDKKKKRAPQKKTLSNHNPGPVVPKNSGSMIDFRA
jgi:hypothetical protein